MTLAFFCPPTAAYPRRTYNAHFFSQHTTHIHLISSVESSVLEVGCDRVEERKNVKNLVEEYLCI